MFTTFSSNIDSIHAKIAELRIFINIDFEFSALCFQECQISEGENLDHLQIPGYTCISKGKSVSRKGGLIIYLLEKFEYIHRDFYSNSDICEAQFIEIFGNNLNKNVILGNLYRPPRNSTDNYATFTDEFAQLLSLFESSNKEFILAGDTNINK